MLFGELNVHIHIVLPEVQPNISVWYEFDLGLFRPASAFSIANYSDKLGCKLVEMSLAASLMLKGRNNLLVLLYPSVFETQHLSRSTVFHMVVPEVKPNAIVWHANDLGLFRPASAFSIANYSGKLCFTLVEMSLSAFLMSSLISEMLNWRNDLSALFFLSVFGTQHVPTPTVST